jgi:hypothetical protein
MKRETHLILVWLAVLIAVSSESVMGARCSRGSQKSTDGVESWVRDNYEGALDLAIPERCMASKETRWVACVRIVPGYSDDLEYSMSVDKRLDGAIFARVTRPKVKSVHMQLSAQKKQHARASLDDLAKLIKLESQEGDQRRFPGLVGLADEFEKIRFSPALSDELMMDATQYHFRVASFSGERMEVMLQGPGAAAAHQPQMLIGWAESVRAMLASAFRQDQR